ncbi:hypothetical protein MCOR21_002653 [Pyricularia oryzae]|nr:hypothetical protein MCOR32_006507 [Pyricularia oryzae]KAI6433930.1 hypothetical protein MCOR21_002653 [Pyricularia oryzae]KAI6448671.1 hypothetical protein MCOR22_002738 [Pyricularia oryzae]KAI6598311.1 hypothetical protein MCOR06_001717 [Pyricularia oryzae]KAI6619813.1 hypothetical protein MCOR08_008750 [Pyricularia oryzae]
MSRDILERAKSSIRLHGRHINNHLEGTPKATQAMSLSKRLARPVATLARWNRPVLHRCLHQPSDPRQSGNQQKADHAPDAQNDPTQGPPGSHQDPPQTTQSGGSNASSLRPNDYKTRPWIRAVIALGVKAKHPVNQGGIGLGPKGSDGNSEAAAKVDSTGSTGSSKPPSSWILEALNKMFQRKRYANSQRGRPAVFIRNNSGGQLKSDQSRKDVMDKILREKYGIEDPEKRKRIIENSKTIEVDLRGSVLSLILIFLVSAIIYLKLKEMDRRAQLGRLRETQTATRQEQIEVETQGTDGQYPMMDDSTKLSST